MSITLSHAGLPVLKALKCQSSRKCVSIHPFHTDSISVSLMFNEACCVYYDLIIPNLKPTPQPLKTFIIYRRKEEKKNKLCCCQTKICLLHCGVFTCFDFPLCLHTLEGHSWLRNADSLCCRLYIVIFFLSFFFSSPEMQ